MISKTVRRMLAVSLAAVMAVGAMAGCGSKDDPGATPTDAPEAGKTDDKTPEATKAPEATATPTPTPIPEAYIERKDANGNIVDLGGIEVIIRDWWSGGTAVEDIEPQNAFDEARKEYLLWAQDTYNFTIKEMAIGDWGSNPQDFIDYATTGGDEYYVFCLRQGGEMISAMNSGLMYDVSTLDCLDFSKDKWSSGVHKLLSKNGAIYGFRGIDAEPRGCMYFNKRLLTEAGIDPQELYDLQEKGEWTWAKFDEICSKVQRDIDSDGIIDVYGMVQQQSEFHKAAVIANGGSFIGKDDSGKFFNNLGSKETLEALNWSTSMQQKYLMPQGEGQWDYFISAFNEGKAVFFADQVYRAGQMINNEARLDDFGCIVFPKNQDNKNVTEYVSFYEDNVYVIPACYDEEKAWKVAFAYDLYTQPIPEFEDYSAWQQGQYANFCDIESVELTLTHLLNRGEVLHHTFITDINMGEDLMWGLGFANSEGVIETPAEAYERLKDSWNAKIDAANNN
ncbi:MAG: hypothetical protein IKL28_07735 [Lachnospiraceae bacterium]|nr:hypothetical protein [Lachnospiraceae bacterium]